MKANAVLNAGNISHAKLLVIAVHIINAMTGNALFAAADIIAQMATTNTAITNLRTAVSAPKSETKADNITVARDALDRQLRILASKVEAVANNPALPDDQREGIIHSAGMAAKTKATPKKRVFAVKKGNVDGSVRIVAEGGAKAHEWQYTSDVVNFTNRIPLDTTTKSSTDLSGLTSGNKYAFFHKPIVVGTATAWEGPLTVMVL